MFSGSIAHDFAKAYYTRLSDSPELAYRFYGIDSTLVYGTEGSSSESSIIKGQAEIKTVFADEGLKNVAYLIRDVVSIPSANDCLLITVLGEMAKGESDSQQFAETFVLSRTNASTYYILSDVRQVFNPEFDAEITPEIGAVNGASQLVQGLGVEDQESKKQNATDSSSRPHPNPNSWASILAKPQTSPSPPVKAAPRIAVNGQTSPSTAPRPPGPFSAFIKLSSNSDISKPQVVKALAPFGPISNLQLDLHKKRGYVDFPDKRMFEKALKTARVKISGSRESIEILKRFTGPPPSGPKANGTASSKAPADGSYSKTGKKGIFEKH